jgi:hypothetical protein
LINFLLVIALYDIAFVATKESLPSWRLTFLLVTNQLSLNTKNFQIITLDHNNCG